MVLTLYSKKLAAGGDTPSDARDKESYHSLFLSQYWFGKEYNRTMVKIKSCFQRAD